MYFSLAGDPASRYLLFGALVARARVLQATNPQLRARLYTSIAPTDTQMKDFYLHNGFDCDEADQVLQLAIPLGDGPFSVDLYFSGEPESLQRIFALL